MVEELHTIGTVIFGELERIGPGVKLRYPHTENCNGPNKVFIHFS
jgi:hypothetical protein